MFSIQVAFLGLLRQSQEKEMQVLRKWLSGKNTCHASLGDLPVFKSQALRYKARHGCMYMYSQHLGVSRVWREVVPGFPWLANMVKRAGFWLRENLSDGSKVDNNRRQVVYLLSAQAGMYARARARAHTRAYTHTHAHMYTHTQGEEERHRCVGFSLGHAADLSGCRESVVTRELRVVSWVSKNSNRNIKVSICHFSNAQISGPLCDLANLRAVVWFCCMLGSLKAVLCAK